MFKGETMKRARLIPTLLFALTLTIVLLSLIHIYHGIGEAYGGRLKLLRSIAKGDDVCRLYYHKK